MSDDLNADGLGADDLDAGPDPSGTERLARAALASPDPPAGAEAASLARAEALMGDAALSPRPLRETSGPPAPAPWWTRLRFWKR